MTPYTHLPGYLHRWCLVKLGRFMLRKHDILTPDETPFLHSHPFWYVSIVLRGGYRERVLDRYAGLKTVQRRKWSIVFRRPGTMHRIDWVWGDCQTLFFTWAKGGKGQNWSLFRYPFMKVPEAYCDYPDGVWLVDGTYRKRWHGIWYARRDTVEAAHQCTDFSIHQNVRGLIPEQRTHELIPKGDHNGNHAV